MKVLVTDPVPDKGIDILRTCAEVDIKTGLKAEEIKVIIGDYEALLVRSQTRVTGEIIEAGKKLEVIARAGVGIDNVDVETATQCGIIVVNAPTGNTVSAAEHTIALMLALARHIPQANTALKSGEWRRNNFVGTELRGKTMGIIGLGNVGSEVARRARGFEMKLIGNDPMVSADYAAKLQIKPVALQQLLKDSDFISLHIPSNARTMGLIGAKELAMVKPTVRIINCARGGLINEEALVKAVRGKRVAGAAIDVFETEPITKSILFENDNIIVTPHLGASTTEAQIMAAKDVAEQIVEVFKGQQAVHALNAPFIPTESLSSIAPYMSVASVVGKLAYKLAEGQAKTIQIKYIGEISSYDTNALKAAALSGLLENISEERINLINANLIAKKRGLTIVEQKEATCENYTSLISMEITTTTGITTGITTVTGTIMHGKPHIVQVNEYWLDIEPTGGYFLFSDHRDRPGLIGTVGKITGDADINISFMHVSRLKSRGQALMVLALDEPLSEEKQQQILSIPDINTVKLVRL